MAPAPPKRKKRRIGLIVGLSIMGFALLVLAVGFLFAAQVIGWIRGYEKVPTTAAEV